MRTPNKRFLGKIVIVTGGGSGLGLAIAHRFAREGATLVIAGRNPDSLAKAVAEIQRCWGTRIAAVPCDVTHPEEVAVLVNKTVEEHRRIDILVNNAGCGLIAPVQQVRLADAKALFEVNLFGAFNCIQAVLPHMRTQRAGYIVNVASLAGLRGIPNSAIYSASKAALIALADSLRIEMKRDGVVVTSICPSQIQDTAFFARAKTQTECDLYKVPHMLHADTVAQALLDAVSKRKPLVVLPFHAQAMYIANKFAPRFIDRILYRRLPRSTPSSKNDQK